MRRAGTLNYNLYSSGLTGIYLYSLVVLNSQLLFLCAISRLFKKTLKCQFFFQWFIDIRNDRRSFCLSRESRSFHRTAIFSSELVYLTYPIRIQNVGHWWCDICCKSLTNRRPFYCSETVCSNQNIVLNLFHSPYLMSHLSSRP